jgi:hypothetical protein
MTIPSPASIDRSWLEVVRSTAPDRVFCILFILRGF